MRTPHESRTGVGDGGTPRFGHNGGVRSIVFCKGAQPLIKTHGIGCVADLDDLERINGVGVPRGLQKATGGTGVFREKPTGTPQNGERLFGKNVREVRFRNPVGQKIKRGSHDGSHRQARDRGETGLGEHRR